MPTKTPEVIKPKTQHDFSDILESPFKMMDYTQKQDKLLIEYQEEEIKLLTEIRDLTKEVLHAVRGSSS